jgi:hypothetical protein
MATLYALVPFVPQARSPGRRAGSSWRCSLASSSRSAWWLLRFNPDLLAERMNGAGRPDQEAWDKVLRAVTVLAFLA